MMTFPDGRSWGHLDAETVKTILTREEPVERLAGAYRGWSSHGDEALQLLEREALMRFGWSWLEYLQAGRIVSVDELTGVRRVEIVAESPDGERIEIAGDLVPDGIVSAKTSCDGDNCDTTCFAVTNIELRVLALAS